MPTRERRAYFSAWFTAFWGAAALLMFAQAFTAHGAWRALPFVFGVALLACLPRMVRSAVRRTPPTWPW